MAAGFSIETEKIELFTKKINKYAKEILTDGLLERKLKVDCEINFDQINYDLYDQLKEFEPTGLGNFTPTFVSRGIELVYAKLVGRESKHIKLRLKQGEYTFDSIYFGGGEMYPKLVPGSKIDAVYQIDENLWNGDRNLQLMIRDIHV